MKNARKVLVSTVTAGILTAAITAFGVAAGAGDPDWDSVQAGAGGLSQATVAVSPDDHDWD